MFINLNTLFNIIPLFLYYITFFLSCRFILLLLILLSTLNISKYILKILIFYAFFARFRKSTFFKILSSNLKHFIKPWNYVSNIKNLLIIKFNCSELSIYKKTYFFNLSLFKFICSNLNIQNIKVYNWIIFERKHNV